MSENVNHDFCFNQEYLLYRHALCLVNVYEQYVGDLWKHLVKSMKEINDVNCNTVGFTKTLF